MATWALGYIGAVPWGVAKQLAPQGPGPGGCWAGHRGAQAGLWRNSVVRPAWRAPPHTMAGRWPLGLATNTGNQKGATTKGGGLATPQPLGPGPSGAPVACVVPLGYHPTPSCKNKQTTWGQPTPQTVVGSVALGGGMHGALAGTWHRPGPTGMGLCMVPVGWATRGLVAATAATPAVALALAAMALALAAVALAAAIATPAPLATARALAPAALAAPRAWATARGAMPPSTPRGHPQQAQLWP